MLLPPGNAGRAIRVSSLDNQPYRALVQPPYRPLHRHHQRPPQRHGWTIPNRPASDPDNDWVLVLEVSVEPVPALGQ